MQAIEAANSGKPCIVLLLNLGGNVAWLLAIVVDIHAEGVNK